MRLLLPLLAGLLAAQLATGCASRRVCNGPGLPTCECRDNPELPSCLDAGPDAAPPEDAALDAPPEDAPPEDDGGTDAGPCGLCAEPTPLCREADGMCVACLESTDCDDGFCAPDNTCVGCLESTDCDSPTASRCDEVSRECAACAVNDDCNGLGDLGVCDEGECVECAPGQHSTCGAERLCHGELRECVDAVAGAAGDCEPCVADAHCITGFGDRACVRPVHHGEEGFFCLPVAGAGCTRPFFSRRDDQLSIDGEMVDYCAHRTTSCAGFTAFENTAPGTPPDRCETATDGLVVGGAAPGDGACGLPGTEDGTKCRPFGAGAACTYECTSSADCRSAAGVMCTGDPDRFCTFGT